ncbi:MAG: hypothetical protein KDA96_25260, partial [Planctomycetaceae bacterium]|nr:hypothetical protein [Planctomycetaceae bacterium]
MTNDVPRSARICISIDVEIDADSQFINGIEINPDLVHVWWDGVQVEPKLNRIKRQSEQPKTLKRLARAFILYSCLSNTDCHYLSSVRNRIHHVRQRIDRGNKQLIELFGYDAPPNWENEKKESKWAKVAPRFLWLFKTEDTLTETEEELQFDPSVIPHSEIRIPVRFNRIGRHVEVEPKILLAIAAAIDEMTGTVLRHSRLSSSVYACESPAVAETLNHGLGDEPVLPCTATSELPNDSSIDLRG